jgi:hypothetical protein
MNTEGKIFFGMSTEYDYTEELIGESFLVMSQQTNHIVTQAQ